MIEDYTNVFSVTWCKPKKKKKMQKAVNKKRLYLGPENCNLGDTDSGKT